MPAETAAHLVWAQPLHHVDDAEAKLLGPGVGIIGLHSLIIMKDRIAAVSALSWLLLNHFSRMCAASRLMYQAESCFIPIELQQCAASG